MKMYTKMALIVCSVSAPVFANESNVIDLVQHFTGTVTRFKDAMDAICVAGSKDGITALHDLRKDLANFQMPSFENEVGTAMATMYRKFNAILGKVCNTLQFAPGKTFSDITLELTKSFDIKKLFPEMITDLQQVKSLAEKNNFGRLVIILDELLTQVQAEQKKWSNASGTMFSKLVQSIKSFLHMHK